MEVVEEAEDVDLPVEMLIRVAEVDQTLEDRGAMMDGKEEGEEVVVLPLVLEVVEEDVVLAGEGLLLVHRSSIMPQAPHRRLCLPRQCHHLRQTLLPVVLAGMLRHLPLLLRLGVLVAEDGQLWRLKNPR